MKRPCWLYGVSLLLLTLINIGLVLERAKLREQLLNLRLQQLVPDITCPSQPQIIIQEPKIVIPFYEGPNELGWRLAPPKYRL